MAMPWHEDAFLLLPGDGFLLVDEAHVVGFVNRFGQEMVQGCPQAGDDLRTAWPEAATVLAHHAHAIIMSGPVDATVMRNDQVLRTRLFRTDSGWGIGILVTADDRVGTGPSFALYDRVLRAVNETVMVTTAEPIGRPGPIIVYVNDAFLRDSGYERHEVLGRSPRMMQGPMTGEEPRAEFRHLLEKWGTSTVVLENVRKDGTPFWVEIDVAPVADATGWYTHWVSVQQDVTERKVAEAEREGRTAMVQTILDSLPSQSALLDHRGQIVATNAAWSDVWLSLGAGPEPDWHTVNYLEVCRRSAETPGRDAADAASAAEGIAGVLEGVRDSFRLDYEISAGETTRWYHLEVRPLRGREGVIVTHVDITRRRQVEEELGYQAAHDPLTGLANRDALLRRLTTLTDARQATPFAVALIDLDDFRTVNDAYGHAYGDRILEIVAERLESLVDHDDLVARLGGDEFALVLAGVGPDRDTEELFSAVRDRLSDPIDLDIVSVRLSASMGVVLSPPHTGDADAMIRDADTAMYVSKTAGRDRWTLFDEPQRVSARARAISQERIAKGVARGEFVLWFQPFVELSTGRTVASEALLRWMHPTDGLLTPAAFLSAIESGPLIDDVGGWVLDQALAVQAQWLGETGFDRHVMSVNVSPRQLGRGVLPGMVLDALERHGVAPGNLGLEVLESDLVTRGDKVEHELRELHELGVGIAIDDFGTGYSALAYLQTFPVDAVKIDRAFVQRSSTPRGARLLRAAGELARAVDAISVAEGIETHEQLMAVQSAGVTWGQGYLLGRPAAAGPTPAVAEGFTTD